MEPKIFCNMPGGNPGTLGICPEARLVTPPKLTLVAGPNVNVDDEVLEVVNELLPDDCMLGAEGCVEGVVDAAVVADAGGVTIGCSTVVEVVTVMSALLLLKTAADSAPVIVKT